MGKDTKRSINMNTDVTLVTALYHHPPTSRIGGRGWCFDFWKAPFKNILSLGLPLVIYTHEINDQAKKLKDFLKEENFDNYEIIIHNLENFKLSEKIYQIKESIDLIDDNGLSSSRSLIENHRNHHLCLQKIFWLKDQANRNPFNSSKFFWIDFGLFHHTIFPDSLGGMEKLIPVRKENYWPECKTNMFSPALADALIKYVEDKFFCIIHEQGVVGHELYVQADSPKPHAGYIIGGLFGGSKEIVNYIQQEFDKVMNVLYENNQLVLEEPILSIVYSNNVEMCKTVSFLNWYHDCPGGAIDRCNYGITSDVKSFYKVFYNDLLGLYKTPNP